MFYCLRYFMDKQKSSISILSIQLINITHDVERILYSKEKKHVVYHLKLDSRISSS